MLPKVQRLQIKSIDRNDTAFQVSTSTDIKALRASMKHVGLLHFPALHHHNNCFRIISGFARIAAAADLGWGDITARILPKTTSLKICIRMAIADNCCHRKLNLVELGRCIALLSTVFSEPEHLESEANALGLGVNREMIDKLKSVNRMPAALQQGLIEQSIALPMALRIQELQNHSEIDALGRLLLELNLSLNRQRELIDWIEAISRKDKLTITELLEEPRFLQILEDPDLDAPQKSSKIRLYFKRRRYPTIVETEEHYRRCLKRTKIPKGIQLIPPSNFESDRFTIKADFKSPEDLLLINQRIEDLARSEAMAKMLKI
jgi:hypothetical protein